MNDRVMEFSGAEMLLTSSFLHVSSNLFTRIAAPKWVESVYRGFTPQGLQRFLDHSCTHSAFLKCSEAGMKQCIVDYHEKALTKSYKMFEARSIYPSYYPTQKYEIKYWKKEGLDFTKQQSDFRGDPWIHGRKYHQHLLTEFNFPLAKVKATIEGGTRGVNSECFNTVADSFFDSLRYPTKEEMAQTKKRDPLIPDKRKS